MSREIEFLYEDEDWIVVDKPAPLAVHACGRYCRHSLVWLLSHLYAPDKPRPAHRLDVSTTGVMVFTRNRMAASRTQKQFEAATVRKVYAAWVHGHPEHDEFRHEAPISRRNEDGRRTIDLSGQAAVTEFRVVARLADGTSVLDAFPLTGRTNQIRLHLADLGHPIVGDPWYGFDPERRASESERPMGLHARSLTLVPVRGGEPMEFQARLPAWWPESGTGG